MQKELNLYNGAKKLILKTEKKKKCCITLSPSAKMALEQYAMQRGFTGISAIIEFWAHNIETMKGENNGKKNIN